jgi:formate hydrogenlyase transcriptional activator
MSPFVGLSFEPQRQTALLEVADFVSFRYSPADLFPQVAPRLRALVPFDGLNFALYDPSQKKMKMRWWDETHGLSEPMEIGVDESIVGSVWRNQIAACVDNLNLERQYQPEAQWLQERGMSSYCAFPLTIFREKLGSLGFASARVAAFAENDVNFFRYAVELLALGLDSALPGAALAEEAGRQRLLLGIAHIAGVAMDLLQSVHSILECLQKWAPQDYVGIYVYDTALQSLRLHMSDPELAEKLAPQGRAPLEGSLAGQSIRSRRTVTLDSSGLAGLSLSSVLRGREMGVRSLCLCPLFTAQQSVGVLKVARRTEDSFSQRDIQILEQVAEMVAPTMERARITSAPSAGPALARAWKIPRIDAIPGDKSEGAHLSNSAQRPRSPADDLPHPFLAPETIMESEPLLTAYFKASKVGLCILDTEFRYLAINDTLAKMNGRPATAHLGKSVREVLGDFAELIEPQFRRVIATGLPVSDLEVSFMLNNRTKPGHWLEHYIPITDSTGTVTKIGVVVIEITEQKELEESLRGVSEKLRQEKKRQEVLAEVSRLLATKWDMRRAFPKVSALLRRVLHQEYAALALREESSGQFVPRAMDFPLAKNPSAGSEIGAARGAGSKALQARSALIFGASEMRQLEPSLAASLTSEGLKSLCCVPLLRPKGPLGVLILGSTRAEAFHTDDLALLNQVSAQLAVAMENAAIAREVEQLRQRLGEEKRNLEGKTPSPTLFPDIIGESTILRKCLDQVQVIAPTYATVLVLGETGTGKGLIARAIHDASKRKDRNFIVLNCAAIPTGLLESELFGHEKGAFTGAVTQKIGRLELADKGTLFLDEIGEIPLEVQPKLLRVLQDYEFERLGGNRTIKVDLRLITATNRDLVKSVAAKEFRSDLFYRLNVFPIRLPSLRERREDIPDLVRYFVRKFSRLIGRKIETVPNEAMEAMVRFSWPGNVRELANFIERSVILTEGTALKAPLAELQFEMESASDHSLQAREREHIIRVLRETEGTLAGPNGAARRLGLKRTTLQSRMQRLGITPKDYRGPKPS